MQAIETQFIGPTTRHKSRIKARTFGAFVTVPYDHRLTSEQNHAEAARELARQMGWIGYWIHGALRGDRHAFVPLPLAPDLTRNAAFGFDLDDVGFPLIEAPTELTRDIARRRAPVEAEDLPL